MPTYDYQCRSCGYITEVVHSMLAEGPSVCERCGGELRRVIHPTGIIFKGGGFYKTDSRSSSSSGSGGASRGTAGSGEGAPSASSAKEGKSSDAGGASKSSGGSPAKGESGGD